MKKMVTHPITLAISFCVILIGGQVFAAPYGWIIRYASPAAELFAIIGAVALAVTVLSIFIRRRVLQILGLLLMWISLVLFYAQSLPESRGYMFGQWPTALSALPFVVVTMMVIAKQFQWKNS